MADVIIKKIWQMFTDPQWNRYEGEKSHQAVWVHVCEPLMLCKGRNKNIRYGE